MNNNYPDDCQGNGRHLPWNDNESTLDDDEIEFLNEYNKADHE